MMNTNNSTCWIIVLACVGSCLLFGSSTGSDCKLYTENGSSWPKLDYFISAEKEYLFTASCRCYYKSPIFREVHLSSPKYHSIKDGSLACIENGEKCSHSTLTERSTNLTTYIEYRLVNYTVNETTSIVCGNNALNFVPAVIIEIKESDSIKPADSSPTSSVMPSPSLVFETPSVTIPTHPSSSPVVVPPSPVSSPSPSVQPSTYNEPSCTPAIVTVTVTSSYTVPTTVTVVDPSVIADTDKIIDNLEANRDNLMNITIILGGIVGVLLIILCIILVLILVYRRRPHKASNNDVGRLEPPQEQTEL